jgi:hypothetical protein
MTFSPQVRVTDLNSGTVIFKGGASGTWGGREKDRDGGIRIAIESKRSFFISRAFQG